MRETLTKVLFHCRGSWSVRMRPEWKRHFIHSLWSPLGFVFYQGHDPLYVLLRLHRCQNDTWSEGVPAAFQNQGNQKDAASTDARRPEKGTLKAIDDLRAVLSISATKALRIADSRPTPKGDPKLVPIGDPKRVPTGDPKPVPTGDPKPTSPDDPRSVPKVGPTSTLPQSRRKVAPRVTL
jgi:hypothetical protein